MYAGILRRLMNSLSFLAGDQRRVPVYYSDSAECFHNFGDAMNRYLIKEITGKDIIGYSQLLPVPGICFTTGIGSILDGISLPCYDIWGSGFMFPNGQVRHLPRMVYATRGPLTACKLGEQGMKTSPVFGDPAIIARKFWSPVGKKYYKYGVIPHYVDRADPRVQALEGMDHFTVIDVTQKPTDVIERIASCERILSSTLHGLIMSDLYEVPNAWIRFSTNICGGDFKYLDYYQSLNGSVPSCRKMPERAICAFDFDECTVHSISDRQIDRLLDVAPF